MSLVLILDKYVTAHDAVKPDFWEASDVTLTAQDKLDRVLERIWVVAIDFCLCPPHNICDQWLLLPRHGLGFSVYCHPQASNGFRRVHGLGFIARVSVLTKPSRFRQIVD